MEDEETLASGFPRFLPGAPVLHYLTISAHLLLRDKSPFVKALFGPAIPAPDNLSPSMFWCLFRAVEPKQEEKGTPRWDAGRPTRRQITARSVQVDAGRRRMPVRCSSV